MTHKATAATKQDQPSTTQAARGGIPRRKRPAPHIVAVLSLTFPLLFLCSHKVLKTFPSIPSADGPAVVQVFPDEPVPSVSTLEVQPVLKPVYFDFDAASIRWDARDALMGMLPEIRGRIIVSGYCDERGSIEYNLALGKRRAMAVKVFLGTHGVPLDSMGVVSYGKTELVREGCGDDETCNQENRRVEIRVER